jgi:hypothetical protein
MPGAREKLFRITRACGISLRSAARTKNYPPITPLQEPDFVLFASKPFLGE